MLRATGIWICFCFCFCFWSLASVGCRHQGAGWRAPEVRPSSTPSVEILVLGQARDNAATRHVAVELEAHLERRLAAYPGRPAIVLWLGTDHGRPGADPGSHPRAHCPEPGATQPDLEVMAAVLARHRDRGGEVWGLPGPDAWRCPEAPRMDPPHGPTYVLRVDAQGKVELASDCGPTRCTVAPPTAGTVLEIVALDFSPWHYPELASNMRTAALMAQQQSLLEALAAQTYVVPPPRLLVSPIPADSAGHHGFAGRSQRTGFRYLPEPLQDALAQGLFTGVVGGLERSLQISEDLNPAIVRSARRFIAKPVFQVVSGAAGGGHFTPVTSRAHGLIPELESEHAGFASLSLRPGGSCVELRLHTRLAGRWREGRVRVPLRPAPLGELRPATRIQPCEGCDPTGDATDGVVFVPRGPRPR